MSEIAARARIGVLGGSGFYRFVDDVTEIEVATPYGPPAGPIHLGTVAGEEVAFLPRHGVDHRFAPHTIPYRANLWALHELGVQWLLGPCASGSLQAGIAPGDFVVCDQLVDFTSGRADTFFDGPLVHHLSFADPYCHELRAIVVATARDEQVKVHEQGTVVVIGGPRFATRAESAWYRMQGWDVINMTQYPEAALAAELGMSYSAIALITDYDAGLEGVEGVAPVTQDEVFAFFEANVDRVRSLLFKVIAAIPDRPPARASQPRTDPVPPAARAAESGGHT